MIAVLFAILAVLPAAANDYTDIGVAKLHRIEACIEKPAAPKWAGDYFDYIDEHGMHDTRLHLCTDGYVHNSVGINDNVWESSYGTVEQLAKDRLRLRSAVLKRERVIRLITWGDCVYAVYEEKMPDFVKVSNRGSGGSFLSRCGEEKKRKGSGKNEFPVIPPQWRGLQSTSTIQAVIVSVGPIEESGNTRTIPVKISAGTKHGLRAGQLMTLCCSERALDEDIEILRADEAESEGKVVQYNTVHAFAAHCQPAVGQRASSRIR